MSRLTGKVALVTGGNSGIGLATAKRFADEGARVFISGRRLAELEKAVAFIGNDAVALQGDVANVDDIDRMVAAMREHTDVLDIIVANAGIIENQTIEVATVEHYDRIFNVNARGAFFTVQKALPLMTRGGSIVVMSSIMGNKGYPGIGAYSATKAVLRSFARTWANELKDRGIRVNSLSPGATATPGYETQVGNDAAATVAITEMFSSLTPQGRIAAASEIASAALFLVSDDASFTNGADLIVDGGMVAV